jgi:hypothetical protein
MEVVGPMRCVFVVEGRRADLETVAMVAAVVGARLGGGVG